MSLFLKSLTRIETRPLKPVSEPEPIVPLPNQIAEQADASAALLEDIAAPPVAIDSQEEIIPLDEIDPLDDIIAAHEPAFDQAEVNLAEPLSPLPDLAEFSLTEPLPPEHELAEMSPAAPVSAELLPSEPASSFTASPPENPLTPVEQPTAVKPLAVETIAAFSADFQSGSEVDWLQLEQLQNMVTANLANLTASDYDIAEIDLSHIAPAPSALPLPPPADPPPPSPSPEVIELQTEVFRLHAAEVERLQSEVARLQAEVSAPKVATAPEPAVPAPSLEVSVPPTPFPEFASLPAPAPAVSPANWPGGIPVFSQPPEPPQRSQPPLNIRPKFRELRDQLLAKLDLTQHPTLLLVDAGRESGDASWLWPLAAAILDKLNATRGHAQSRILLIEATDADCRLAQTLGLDTHLGLNHVLNNRSDWQAAIQSTLHPQIKLLCCGSEYLQAISPQQLKDAWTELSQQFDLLLVAVGPLGPHVSAGNSGASITSALRATDLFPLASAAMLYVELGSTSSAAAAHAKRLLDAHAIPVLGCVVQPV